MRPVKNPVSRFFIYFGLLIFVLINSLPFVWAVLQSLKTLRQANSRIPLVIFKPTLNSYLDLWFKSVPDNLPLLGLGFVAASVVIIMVALTMSRRNTGKVYIMGFVVVCYALIFWTIPQLADTADWYDYFVNTLIVTVFAVSISVSLSAMAGYAISRYRGSTGAVVLTLALALGALPAFAFAMPYFQLSAALGLQDSYVLLIAVMVGLSQPFAIWMLRGFFWEIPKEIDESALMDGASHMRAFWAVIAPIAWPGIIAVALLNTLGVYHSFLIVRVLTQVRWTMAVGMTKYVGTVYAASDTIPFAAAVSASVPLLILVFFFQDQLVKGLGAGAVKG
ncbi:MAG: carbohydrate ABC transporter permease [Candidatus Promineifilaceae bacterium]|nr:carbohydrate ABC transporter permease [Candidatus Promineifilaceae bacterium]